MYTLVLAALLSVATAKPVPTLEQFKDVPWPKPECKNLTFDLEKDLQYFTPPLASIVGVEDEKSCAGACLDAKVCVVANYHMDLKECNLYQDEVTPGKMKELFGENYRQVFHDKWGWDSLGEEGSGEHEDEKSSNSSSSSSESEEDKEDDDENEKDDDDTDEDEDEKENGHDEKDDHEEKMGHHVLWDHHKHGKNCWVALYNAKCGDAEKTPEDVLKEEKTTTTEDAKQAKRSLHAPLPELKCKDITYFTAEGVKASMTPISSLMNIESQTKCASLCFESEDPCNMANHNKNTQECHLFYAVDPPTTLMEVYGPDWRHMLESSDPQEKDMGKDWVLLFEMWCPKHPTEFDEKAPPPFEFEFDLCVKPKYESKVHPPMPSSEVMDKIFNVGSDSECAALCLKSKCNMASYDALSMECCLHFGDDMTDEKLTEAHTGVEGYHHGSLTEGLETPKEGENVQSDHIALHLHHIEVTHVEVHHHVLLLWHIECMDHTEETPMIQDTTLMPQLPKCQLPVYDISQSLYYTTLPISVIISETPSEKDCASLCLDRPDCCLSNYNPTTKECRLHRTETTPDKLEKTEETKADVAWVALWNMRCVDIVNEGETVGEAKMDMEKKMDMENKEWEKMGEEKTGMENKEWEKIGEEKMGMEKMGEEKMGMEKMGEEKMGMEKMGEEKMGMESKEWEKMGEEKIDMEKREGEKQEWEKMEGEKKEPEPKHTKRTVLVIKEAENKEEKVMEEGKMETTTTSMEGDWNEEKEKMKEGWENEKGEMMMGGQKMNGEKTEEKMATEEMMMKKMDNFESYKVGMETKCEKLHAESKEKTKAFTDEPMKIFAGVPSADTCANLCLRETKCKGVIYNMETKECCFHKESPKWSEKMSAESTTTLNVNDEANFVSMWDIVCEDPQMN